MATGYTNRLEEMGYDVKRWLKESAVRAMGVCVSLRDDDMTLTEAEIKDRLKKASNPEDSYHTVKLRADTKRLAMTLEQTDKEWRRSYESEKFDAELYYKNSVKEFKEKKAAYEKAMREIDALIEQDDRSSDVVAGTLKFAKEQLLDACQWDFSRPPEPGAILSQTPEQYRAATIKNIEGSIRYHKAALADVGDTKKEFDRQNAYVKFTQFVDKAKLPKGGA